MRPLGTDTLGHDLRHAVRSLARSPGFVATAVLSLALGIGASAAAYSVLDAVRFRALPFPDADRLVVVSELPKTTRGGAEVNSCRIGCDVSYETFSQVLQPYPFRSADMVVGYTSGAKGLETGTETLLLTGGVVSPNAFTLLEAHPLIGRVITSDDDRLGAPPVVVLGHELWTSQFGQDRGILGRVVKLSDTRYTVIGVMPAGFEFEAGAKFWLAAVPTLDPSTRPSIRSLTVFARLRRGATLQQLRAELSTIATAPPAGSRGQAAATRLDAAPLRDRYVASTQSHDTIFAAVVGCVLLIAVANLATLLLVRTLQQERELAVRAALGGGGGRLAGYVFAQNLCLVACGSVLGIILSRWSLNGLRSLAVLNSLRPAGMEYRIDARSLLFAIALSLVVVAVLSILPVRIVRRLDVQRVLRESAPSGGGRAGGRTQRAFVIAQMACAVVLLAGAGLMTKTVLRLTSVDLGFDSDYLAQGTPSYPHVWRVKETYMPVTDRILAGLHALPGTADAALRASTRLGTRGAPAEVRLSGDDRPLPASLAPSSVVSVSPGYFAATGVRLASGRTFNDLDREGTVSVAIVNEWAARRWWPGESALGKTFRIDSAPGAGVTLTVVGVARDNKAAQPNVLLSGEGPEVYRPYLQAPSAFPTFLVRVDRRMAPAGVLRSFRAALVASVPDRPVFVSLVSEQVARQLSAVRTNALQILAFAGAGLLLTLVGVHGVHSYAVSRRTRELGIRGALGATRGRLRLMVLRDAALLAGAGLAVGLPLAAASTPVIASLLHGTSAVDASVYTSVAVVLLVVTLVASWIPAHRASRADPLSALRAG